MGVTYSNSWIVFSSALQRALLILACGALGAVLSRSETLTGVVYSDEIGNGTHPAGRFELAVGKKTYTVQYGEPLERHFQDTACNDIGSEWSVLVAHVDGMIYADSVTCAGRTDDEIHARWVLVRSYLQGLHASGISTSGLSYRYRSSPEFRSLVQRLSSHDLNFYLCLEHMNKCLSLVSVESPTRVRLATHGTITLQQDYVVLLFDVERNRTTGKWEIDGIEIK